MSNKTDTIYRCYGSADTLKRIADNVDAGMTLYKAVKALGYQYPNTTFDNYVMRGEVLHVDASKDYVDIESEDAWTEQQDFISALQLVFKDDDLFRIEYQCEEPGCEYYATNVEGALFGEYVADLNGDIEYCNTFYELKKRVIKYVHSQEPFEDFSNVFDFDDLKAYCDEYEEQHENKYLDVHQFILDD